jgi:hypothetical protein
VVASTGGLRITMLAGVIFLFVALVVFVLCAGE